MANQNSKIYGWCPSKDYQVHEVMQPALRKRFDRPRHNKGHVAFKTNNNEEHVAQVKEAASNSPEPESETTIKHNKQSGFESVDSFDRPRHNKGHVAFKTNNYNEEHVAQVKEAASNSPVPESETTTKHNKHNGVEGVDQLADSFIKHEHKRIELARLISMQGAK